jgi:deoxyribonuclease-2
VSNVVLISTANMMHLDFFAKTAEWGLDLWGNAIAPFYRYNFEVESWLHGDDPEGPACSNYTIYDIKYLELSPFRSFDNYNDHSKWGISTLPNTNIICFGDINRMNSQKSRGGSAFCFENNRLWNILYRTIRETDSCSKKML